MHTSDGNQLSDHSSVSIYNYRQAEMGGERTDGREVSTSRAAGSGVDAPILEQNDPPDDATAIIQYARALRGLGSEQQDRVAALEIAILGWLDAKHGRSGSERTRRAYADTLTGFRAALHQERLDLDGPPTAVALVAQAWAGSAMQPQTIPGAQDQQRRKQSEKASEHEGVESARYNGKREDAGEQEELGKSSRPPATTTYNQRLACVSSFYRYAHKQGILDHNPIERVERRRVQAYAGAKALTPAHVKQALASIDRATEAGARDYALLMIYLQTGRRLSEVAALELGDLEEIGDNRWRVTFRRCKGGKVLYDTLNTKVGRALLTYLHIIYSADPRAWQNKSPVWVSLAGSNGTRGGRLSKVSISRICKSRLGTSKVHALRHTMAHMMEEAGAPVSVIQQRLAHNSLATTGIYLAALRQDDNPYADQIVDSLSAE